MFIKKTAVVSALTFCCFVIGCGGATSDKVSIVATTQSNAIESIAPTSEKSETIAETESEAIPTSAFSNAELLIDGNPVTVGDSCEITLDYANITNDVKPKSPASFYTHYEADPGKLYVDVCIAYKNTATSPISADDTMSGKLLYAGKYEYSGFPIIEEKNRSTFTYANITSISPLSTEYMHYLFEVPEEIKTSGKEVMVYLTVADKEYKIEVTQGSTDAVNNISANSSVSVGGLVSDGETITTSNSEFNVDYSNITNDVKPKKPANFYTHYEANAGKAYVDFCIAYKNTTGSNISAEKVMSASLKYADKYEYSGFSMIEEKNRGSFTYSSITSIAPLATEYMHYLFEVPEEVKNSAESVVIYFQVDGIDFEYRVR